MGEWVSTDDAMPEKYENVFVATYEFGFGQGLAIGHWWKSSENPKPTWYFDRDFYGMENPHMIVHPVTHWLRIEMPTVEKAESE